MLNEFRQAIIALIAGQGGNIDLPNLLISYSVTGGTENAIIAEANLPVPAGVGTALFSIGIIQPNTGNVTINGKPLLTNSGNQIAPGGLVADGVYLFLDDGASYRLVSDQASAALLEAAQEAADRAEGFAAMLSADKIGFKTVALLRSDTMMSYSDEPGKLRVGPGDSFWAGGLRFEVVDENSSTYSMMAAGGVKVSALAVSQRRSAEQYIVVGDVDERSTWQRMLDSLDHGDALHFPAHLTSVINNAVDNHSGGAVARRANAVANNGLRALTCDKDDIRIIIDGHVQATSALDDLFRFTGKRVTVQGSGLVECTAGEFIDENAGLYPGVDQDKYQWWPTLLYLAGDSSCVNGQRGLRFKNPAQASVCVQGDYSKIIRSRFIGGAPSYRPNPESPMGTSLGHINSFSRIRDNPGNLRRTPLNQEIEFCIFEEGPNGETVYSHIFGLSERLSIYDGRYDAAWEHAIYGQRPYLKVVGGIARGSKGGVIQAFYPHARIEGFVARDCQSGIRLQNPRGCYIEGADIETWEGSAISGNRHVLSTETWDDYDMQVVNNRAVCRNFGAPLAGSQAAIQFNLQNGVDGLRIAGNYVEGATAMGAGIEVNCLASRKAQNVEIIGNKTAGSAVSGIVGVNLQRPRIIDNKINDSGSVGDLAFQRAAIRLVDCPNYLVEGNDAVDTRSNPRMSIILLANEIGTARNNNSYGLDLSATKIVSVSGSSEREGNAVQGRAMRGRFNGLASASWIIANAGNQAGEYIAIYPVNGAAQTGQLGAARLYVTATADGSFTVRTANGANGDPAAVYRWEVVGQ